MSRPTTLKVDGTVHWTIMTYTAAGVLVDADSTPTVAIRKNGAATVGAVTVAKRAATTGIYDCQHDPAGEAEGDTFTFEETATISSQAYVNSWQLKVIAAERGTNSANTVAPDNASIAAILVDTSDLQSNQGQWLTASGFSTFDSTNDTVTTDTASRIASKADVSGIATQASVDVIDGIVDDILVDTSDLQSNQGQWLTASGFSTFDASTDTVTTDTASRNASKADVSGVATQASVDVIDGIVDTILLDTNELQVNQSGWTTADVSSLLTASSYASSLPANFDDLAIEVTTGKVTTANPAAGSGSSHTAADVVTAMQAVSSDFKADVSGVATSASVAALNDLSASEVNTQVDTALADIHLDHLLAVDYDPSSKPGVVTALLNELVQDDGGVSQFTQNALEKGPSGGGSGGVVGSGSTAYEVTINAGGNPQDGAEVYVTTDSAGTNVVAGTLHTDAQGKATFQLDAATYYLWVQKAGVNFTNPTSFTVS